MDEQHVCISGILPDRPFTAPDKTLDDLEVLRSALAAVRELAILPEYAALSVYPAIVYQREDGRCHRFVINNARRLLHLDLLRLVGFFGRRHTTIDSEVLNQADALLLTEFGEHPGMLAYCSYQRSADQYGNLVIFDSPAAQLHWSTSRHHHHAARVVAPTYYCHIRLHEGHLIGGLLGDGRVIIEQTKYFDYGAAAESGKLWRGVRTYVAGQS